MQLHVHVDNCYPPPPVATFFFLDGHSYIHFKAMSKKAEEERVASEAAVLAPAIKSEKAAAPKTGSKLPSKAAVSKFLVFSVFALFLFFP